MKAQRSEKEISELSTRYHHHCQEQQTESKNFGNIGLFNIFGKVSFREAKEDVAVKRVRQDK